MNTTIILSDADADLFVAFQKHYDLFQTMEQVGAFKVGYGKVVLNFANNTLQNITTEEVKWKR